MTARALSLRQPATGSAGGLSRRGIVGAGLGLLTLPTFGQPGPALREMQIHKVAELGLEIWVENQPPWETQMSKGAGGQSTFVAVSPPDYHPPVVMMYAGWPKQRVVSDAVKMLAVTAIRTGAANFGLGAAQSRALQPAPATYGVLQGFEADFPGTANGEAVDVKLFVGQASDRFPVALTTYTMRGKLVQLGEPIRRAWTKLRYLAPA